MHPLALEGCQNPADPRRVWNDRHRSHQPDHSVEITDIDDQPTMAGIAKSAGELSDSVVIGKPVIHVRGAITCATERSPKSNV